MGLRKGRKRKLGGGMVNVQCLIGPLLWVTESETSRKAERIRLKDLSQRDDTSSEVIPFVSIFGRIFTLMVPADVEKKRKRKQFTVRNLEENLAFLHIDTDVIYN